MLLAVFMLNATPVIAADFPSCTQILSYQDGDGFGYENSQTCVVDDTTSFVPVPDHVLMITPTALAEMVWPPAKLK